MSPIIICADCGHTIQPGEEIAHTPGGIVHARCAKIGKAQGREITILSLYQEIQALKLRVQMLEQAIPPLNVQGRSVPSP